MIKTRGLLGIDVGTSAVKTALFSDDGHLLEVTQYKYESIHSEGGLVEQDPENWWKGIIENVRYLTTKYVDINIAALAISTQGGTLVPADSSFQPIYPAIVWSDKRCKLARQKLLESFSPEDIYNITGWHLGNGLNLLQILELSLTKPEVFNKATYFLSVPDYLSIKLIGKPVIDVSNAGINQLYNVLENKWDPSLLRTLQIETSQLPDLYPSGVNLGRISLEASEILHLSPNVCYITGGHDQYCAALGVGMINPGDVLIGTGTAWTVNSATKKPRVDFLSGSNFSRHVVTGLFGNLISLSFGGKSLDWFRELIGNNCTQKTLLTYQEIDNIVSERNIDPELLFMPFFNGVYHNVYCQELSASFIGIKSSHDSFDFFRAIMESIAMYVTHLISNITEDNLNKVFITGGAANSDIWVQMVADTLNYPITIPQNKDASCVGAAMLAGIGIGIFQNYENAILQFYRDQSLKIVFPSENAEKMRTKQELFLKWLNHMIHFYDK